MKMTRPRSIGTRAPILGGLIGLLGLFGIRRLRRKSPRRPTGAELAAMTDRDFDAFIRSTGIRTVTSAGLAAPNGSAD